MTREEKSGPEWDARIRKWMHANLDNYADPITWEVSTTQLAEGACIEFDLYLEDDSVPDDLFELAFEVWEDDQTESQRRNMP